ncbi:MAG: hypothetical protein MUF36_11155 [Bacteroidales bacterium]|jgi:hypothetical protein|nr:hypothetical protein [Bacteroidales bacterium]
MKPTIRNIRIASKTRNTLILILLVFSLSSATMNGQDFKKFAFGPGISINIGVFSPEAVNNYIASALSSYTILLGSTDLFMYEEVSAFLNFKTRWVDVSPTLVYAISPKIVIGAENFYFTRVSPGVLANFFIPTGLSGKTAFFIGGGLQYHMLKFTESDGPADYEGNDLGFRFQLGYDMQFGSFNLQPVLAFNVAKTLGVNSAGSRLDMNYTGGQIGINMSFHKPVSHRRF